MSLLNGIGAVLGKAMEWAPSKKESYKNEINKLEKRLSDISKRSPYTTNDSLEYAAVADKLRQIETRYKNI